MTTLWLKFTLESDATFGRGDGMAGMVDAEAQHDEYGLPYLGGRALRGVLCEECANILFALEKQGKAHDWHTAAQHLFGNPGSRDDDKAILHVGDARLPQDLRQTVVAEVAQGNLKREQVLKSLTAIRRQTAVDEGTGAPKKETLRAVRVVLRQTPFEAELSFAREPEKEDLSLLAACIKALRRAGTGRNRGRGELIAHLYDEQGRDVTQEHFDRFRACMAAQTEVTQ